MVHLPPFLWGPWWVAFRKGAGVEKPFFLDCQFGELGSAREDPVLWPGNAENRRAGRTRPFGCCVMLDKPCGSLTYNMRGLG